MSSHPIPSDDNNETSQDSLRHEQQLELGEDESAAAFRKAWEKTLRALANKLHKPTFENFVRPLKPLSFDGKIAVLGAPSSFARQWAEKKYTQPFSSYLEQFLDIPKVEVRFVISTPAVQPLLGEKPLPLQQAASPLREIVPQEASSRTLAPAGQSSSLNSNAFVFELAAAPLNERYTFDHFVIGKSNRLAHAGALAVANSPGTIYNPLFLYGSPGLGKTHLMHAIGHQVRAALPQARVAYVSGETFTNHYVAAIREKRTEDFRRAYRSVDVWLVDDIQTIASKEQTKEEFFHTFNTLHQMNRQIVITSDRSPRELRTMDERLRSRFECGLIADIAPPELEMRMAILQKKAILENLRIPDEVIAYMADLIQSNIRALEGALIKLMAYASLAKSPVTKQLASDVLSSYFVDRPRPARLESAHPDDYLPGGPIGVSPGGATVDRIVETVAVQLGLEPEAILAGGSRRKDVAFARQIAMYLAREMTNVPMTALAASFQCRTHTAISHAHARLTEALKVEPETITIVARIRKVIEYSS